MSETVPTACELCETETKLIKRKFQFTRLVAKCLWICDDCVPIVIDQIREYRKIVEGVG